MERIVVFALGNSVFKEIVSAGLRIEAMRIIRSKYPKAKILSVF